MKKVLSLILAMALILCLGVPAFAADITENQGSASSQVTGTYVAGTAGGTVFSVEIEWSGLEFTYNGESKQEWDPENLEYTGVATPEGWAESNATITVNNRSNTIITAKPSYTKAENYGEVGMEFSVEKLHVLSAEPTGEETTGTVKTGSIRVTPTGKLPADTKDATIGTVTVTITEFADITEDDAQDFIDSLDYKYTSTEYQDHAGHTDRIVLCKAEGDVDLVASGRKYVWAPRDEDHPVEMYDGLGYCSKEEWAVGAPLVYAMDDFEAGEITQAVLNQVYVECVEFDQNLPILVKE